MESRRREIANPKGLVPATQQTEARNATTSLNVVDENLFLPEPAVGGVDPTKEQNKGTEPRPPFIPLCTCLLCKRHERFSFLPWLRRCVRWSQGIRHRWRWW